MRRALIIARREYLSFLRTPGFWVSLMVMPLVGFISTTGPQMIARSEPPPVMVILDQTGLGPAAKSIPRGRSRTFSFNYQGSRASESRDRGGARRIGCGDHPQGRR